ncbi:YbbR-like domain-containing protein [Maribacter halichondriae]|uniref:YbbR-like domain-containing protein n=1 Tax=Maribacter halichondriae TaxID=2980554 RepID=UPI00235895A0|nr:YbbR-like domain-containing protein [Maribacter sp. Hal144]
MIFLLCSATAWFISQLSETYTDNATFDLQFTNIPENYLLGKASREEVNLRVRAGGFQFLRFNLLKNKKVVVDLAQVQKGDTGFFIPAATYRAQIEKQLPGSMALLEMDNEPIYFDFLELGTKVIPVRPRILLNLAQNYLLDGELVVEPNIITIKGPLREIDTITEARTEELNLTDLTSDFSRGADIQIFPDLKNTTFSTTHVILKGRVARFSEKVLKVPVKVVNLPKGTEIRTFPNQVSIVVKAKIDVLKDITDADFQVIADYSSIKDSSSSILQLSIGKRPNNVQHVSLNEEQVEYIIRRE